MVLLKRNKYSTIPIPTPLWKQKLDFRFPFLSSPPSSSSSSSSPAASLFSRFHIEENEKINKAGYTDLEISILLREKDQLQTALLLSSSDDTDKLFIELALLQIQIILDRIHSLTSQPSSSLSSSSDSLSSSSLSSSSDSLSAPPNTTTNNNKIKDDNNIPLNKTDQREDTAEIDQEKKPQRMMDPNAPAFVPSFSTPVYTSSSSSTDPLYNINNNNTNNTVNNNNMNNNNINTEDNSNNNNSKNRGRGEEGDYVYFYQEKAGLKFYLHPICGKAMMIEHGNYANFPDRLSAKILQIEEITVNDYIRKRYKFLSHLPLSTICYFCEVEMKNLVSGKTIKSMGSIFTDRKIARQRLALERQRDASLSTPLFPKPSINWNDSPPLLSFDPSSYPSSSSNLINLNVGDNDGGGDESSFNTTGEEEEMRTPQWVTNGSSLSLSQA